MHSTVRMMFQKLKGYQKEYLCILHPDGTLNELASKVPLLTDEKILDAYHLTVLARQADEWAVSSAPLQSVSSTVS
ncbi:MAG: hypothetical protein V3T35_02185 [Spirochaetia bacterium]